jgi:hypothetical protein
MTFATLDDVVAGLGSLETEFRRRKDRRCVFLSLYGIVSAEMRERVRQQAFADAEWVHRYAVAFANLYTRALTAYDAGRFHDVPKAWRLCFDRARAGTGLVLQDMFLGVNAHVNADLPYALAAISIDPDRAARYQDHAAVNQVLGAVTERATHRLTELYAPGLQSMDDCAGQLDELVSAFSLDIARDSAWEAAVALANAKSGVERALVTTLVQSRAAVVARLLIASTCSPPVAAACASLEQGSAWLTFAAAIKA